MKTIYTLLIILACNLSFYAQTTYVPDNNFEQALIDLGYDTVLDDFVTTANINTIIELDVQGKGISDLTGIEDFLGLKKLFCGNNNLSSIDVSSLLLLEEFVCLNNQLPSLNLTSNIALTLLNSSVNPLNSLNITANTNLLFLSCHNNNLNLLDLSNNSLLLSVNCSQNNLIELDITAQTDLTTLFCSFNELTNIDISNNLLLNSYYLDNNDFTALDLSSFSELERFRCHNNSLSTLNFKNGNNTNISQFFSYGNPNLLCIDVDDEIYSTTNWTSIDMQTIFSEDCNFALSTANETIQSEFSIYPNPVNDVLTIDFSNSSTFDVNIKIYDLLGKIILGRELNSQDNQLNISKLQSGSYFIKIETEKTTAIKRFIKQ